MVAERPRSGTVRPREGGHPPLPLPGIDHPVALVDHRGGPSVRLIGACGEPGALKGARRVREAARGNGPAARLTSRPGPTSPTADFGDPRVRRGTPGPLRDRADLHGARRAR